MTVRCGGAVFQRDSKGEAERTYREASREHAGRRCVLAEPEVFCLSFLRPSPWSRLLSRLRLEAAAGWTTVGCAGAHGSVCFVALLVSGSRCGFQAG